MNKEEKIAFNKKNVMAGHSSRGYGRTYFALRDFEPNEEVMRGHGRVINHQTRHKSVQIGPSKHYIPVLWTGAYWNHSCNPNTYMSTGSDGFPSLYALKKIKKGDEIHYAYGMSELAWSRNAKENELVCRCGARNCKKRILSFSQLPAKERRDLQRKKLCADYLCKVVL